MIVDEIGLNLAKVNEIGRVYDSNGCDWNGFCRSRIEIEFFLSCYYNIERVTDES